MRTLEVLTNFLSLHNTISDGTAEALASLLLVPVITSTIQETVSRFESVVDGLNIGLTLINLDDKLVYARQRSWIS